MGENYIPQTSLPPKAESEPKHSSSFLLAIKSLLTTGILVAVVVIGMGLSGTFDLPFLSRQTDNLSEAQRQERLNAFNALGTVHLLAVSEKDIPNAIESMQLSAAAKQALQADLVRIPSNTSDAADSKTKTPSPSTPSQIVPNPSMKTVTAPSSNPVREVAPAKDHRIRLAWITVWDTDVEDGDVVRIDSQGYSRTILLKKKPLTFAVPVPASGVINVTGILDGDGGGITVGLASGASKAVFPIMSVGQVLGLKVTM
ncbi:MAG: hypothetical protein ABSD50_09700 [Smithella sp.]|jgi:hypothetical protein